MTFEASITAIVGILGVLVGGAVQYYVGRALETRKHFQTLRSAAYADFLSAVAKNRTVARRQLRSNDFADRREGPNHGVR